MVKQLLRGCYKLKPLKEMGASEIGVEELLLQKRYHKNNLDCTGTNEETYCSSTIKKIMGKIEHCNYF